MQLTAVRAWLQSPSTGLFIHVIVSVLILAIAAGLSAVLIMLAGPDTPLQLSPATLTILESFGNGVVSYLRNYGTQELGQ